MHRNCAHNIRNRIKSTFDEHVLASMRTPHMSEHEAHLGKPIDCHNLHRAHLSNRNKMVNVFPVCWTKRIFEAPKMIVSYEDGQEFNLDNLQVQGRL